MIYQPRLLALLVLAFLLVACGGGDAPAASSASEDGAAAQPAGGNVALPADPLAAIQQALTNQQSGGAYRTTTTIDADSEPMVLTGEFIPPDRLRVVTDLGDVQQEMIFIGDKGWMKAGDTWTESPISATQMLGQFRTAIDEFVATATEVRFVGNESLNGQETAVYAYTLDMNKSTVTPMDLISSVKLWVNTATGLPVQQEVTGEAMGVASTTTQVIEYDSSIAIEPPGQQ
jgi:outer membrane lipoprotein-sorting protein